MLGAIIGDIVGSRFEWDNYKAKDFEFFTNDCFFTDDSVMSLALCEALLESKPDFSDLREQAVAKMRAFGEAYPDAGYGRTFSCWLYFDDPQPYNSYGNGSAMRVSGVVYATNTLEQVKQLSLMVKPSGRHQGSGGNCCGSIYGQAGRNYASYQGLY